MRSLLALLRKEMHHIYLSPIAYAFLIVFVGFVTFMFFLDFFRVYEVSMVRFFAYFPIAFAVVIPGVTMRMWAEERKQGTIEFLLTAPTSTWQIVAAKFLGGLSLVVLCVVATLLVPITVGGYGDLDLGPVIGGYLGAILLGGTFLAIGMFLSAFTQDQIVSFLLGVVVLLGLVLIGYPFISGEFGVVAAFANAISPQLRFESIGRGVIDLRDLYYFGATMVLFLYLNSVVIDLRRWR